MGGSGSARIRVQREADGEGEALDGNSATSDVNAGDDTSERGGYEASQALSLPYPELGCVGWVAEIQDSGMWL